MTQTNNQAHFWRQDITGLRALAVLPVLLFHAFPDLLPGGFFGVDIFFVISGYLISRIIFRGLVNNSFSYQDFYFKRIKRIIPNLVVLLLFTAIVGWFVLSALEFRSLGRHISSSAAFYQNFRLIGDVGYFDIASSQKPLLHLWSLAIEEQFYIIFPILCALIWYFAKHSRTIIGYFVAFVTIGSFACCMLLKDPTYRFYFPLARFWELGAGICIAYIETFYQLNTRNFDKGLRNALSCIGFALIVVSMGFYEKTIASPGWFSLMPVLGSALLIVAHVDAVINRTLLAWKPMIFVGLISYSLYLWHWPIISYLHIAKPNAPWHYYLVALIVSFILSVVVYRYIETPFRRVKQVRLTWGGVFLVLVAFVSMGKVIKSYDGFPERPMAKALSFIGDFSYDKDTKKVTINGVPLRCINCDRFPEILFVGDSHIEQYSARVKLLAQKHDKSVAFLTNGGCLVATGLGSEECKQRPKHLQTLISDPRIKTIVIGQIWGNYMNTNKPNFEQAVDIYKELGKHKKVFVILDAPWDYGDFDPVKNIQDRFEFKKNPTNMIESSYPRVDHWARGNQYVKEQLSSTATVIETEQFVCPNQKCNLLNYKDDDHLASSYVKENAFWIDQVF